MIRTIFRAACVTSFSLFLWISCPQNANASAPRHVPDEELAESPLIVVAKWNGADWKNNSLVEDNVVTEYEVATEIEVSRVVKGNIAPGKLTILLEYAIGWSTKDPLVMSYSSTQLAGDADATTDNLWLLTKKRSRLDSKEYYQLSTYRGVQPLALEPYFKALQGNGLAGQIPQLLRSTDRIVQLRTMKVIAGGDYPWPYESWRYQSQRGDEPKKLPVRHKEHAGLVRALVDESTDKDVRQLAAAVFAHAAGAASIPFMRTKLNDDDPEIRAIAVGTLAQQKDLVSADAMAKAVKGVDEPRIACELIKRLAECCDLSAVPALIEFLQNDKNAGHIGNDWIVPAIRSQNALFKLTGHCFAFDVTASREAWSTAKGIADLDQRKAHLTRTIPGDLNPWATKLVIENDRTFVDVTNRTAKALTLAKRATDITVSWSGGVSGSGGYDDTPETKFVTVDPGKSYRFKTNRLPRGVVTDGVPSNSLTLDLAFMSNGNQVGVKAWIGVLTVNASDP
ncbi:MAG: hypothetical protein JWN70_2496 [Planctomycetaceae bacterium]|nr:hypothetical protein [Planctomycetaceae bacterium]